MGALAALALVGVVVWLLWPRVAPVGAGRPAPGLPAPDVTAAPRPDRRLEAPRSAEEEVRDQMGRRRVPYYRFLRSNFAGVIEHFQVDELDTLDLVVSRPDEQTVRQLVQYAVAPAADEYGFAKVRFYARNAPGSVERVRLVAESTRDDTGRWNTFFK